MKGKIELHSARKTYCVDTHRVMPPAETLERIKSVIPEVGITRVADISGLDRVGLPVFSAIRPSAADGAISVYAGKGITESEARVSVIMEAVERFSAEVENFKEQLLFDSYDNLSTDTALLTRPILYYRAVFPQTQSSSGILAGTFLTTRGARPSKRRFSPIQAAARQMAAVPQQHQWSRVRQRH